ncbi:MAG: DUF3037 domain-containing protein [Ferruginibacter sp.]|nr:DUF3037 domain-containing protein [Ferruginibacter sp.]
MQEQNLFEYAVIRVVPRVEREEFMNVGVILYCSKPAFLAAKIHIEPLRLQTFCEKLDVVAVTEALNALLRISAGEDKSGPIGKLENAARFRWLTATRSTVVQTSKVHPGFCVDPAATLSSLFQQLVL